MNEPSDGFAFSLIPIADFRRIFDFVPASCLILDTNFTIVAVNNAYLRDTLTQSPDIICRPIFEIFPDNP